MSHIMKQFEEFYSIMTPLQTENGVSCAICIDNNLINNLILHRISKIAQSFCSFMWPLNRCIIFFIIASRAGAFANLRAVKTQVTQSSKCIALFSLVKCRKMRRLYYQYTFISLVYYLSF